MTYYMEIIVNPSYALKNMGNYSQRRNMMMISGIWYTTRSENITSSPSNTKLPSTSMNTTLETYSGFRSITNYEGLKGFFDMEFLLMLGIMVMLMERLSLCQGGVVVDDGFDFPTENTLASAVASVNLGKITTWDFSRYGAADKKTEGRRCTRASRPPWCGKGIEMHHGSHFGPRGLPHGNFP
jgi:hypothetical protein